MKKTQIIYLIFVVVNFNLFAQGIGLEDVLKAAKRETVFQADREVEIAELQLKIQQSKRIPLVYGEANVQRNLIVPTTPVPSIAFDPNAQPGTITPMRFATDWSAKAGLQLSFDIFNPQLEGAIKEARLNQQKSVVAKNDAQSTSENSLKQMYAEVVLAQEQKQVASQILVDYLVSLEIVKQRLDAGRASQVEYNSTLKKAYELEQLEKEAEMILLNKKVTLSEYLDLDFQQQFTTNLETIIAGIGGESYKNERENLLVEQQLNLLKIKNINKLAIPTLSLNGYLGSQFFNNDFRLFNAEYWYGTSYVNLALRLPITEVFERNLTKKQLVLENAIVESKLSVTTAADGVAEQQRANELLLLKQKIEQQKKIVQLSEENVEIVNAQLQEGVILINDVNKEVEALIDQRKKMWQNQYDYLVELLK